MEHKTGDLFSTTAQAFGHGVNIDGAMGAGIALAFRNRVPGLYTAYRKACRADALQPGGMLPYQTLTGRWVYNMASQDRPGRRARLEWVESSAGLALEHADEHDIATVAIPQIGCGIGGLEWPDVAEVLHNVERWYTARFEVWSLPGHGLVTR